MLKHQVSLPFGRRLRQARQQRGIPQDQLGVSIGLDEGSASARLSRYETGVHEPPHSIAIRLASALDVPTAFFYCENDQLAELLILWSRLSEARREEMVALAKTYGTL